MKGGFEGQLIRTLQADYRKSRINLSSMLTNDNSNKNYEMLIMIDDGGVDYEGNNTENGVNENIYVYN